MNSSKKLAISGIVAGLSFLLTFIEFPIFPAVGFLKFDPSDSLIALVVLLYGWIPAFFTLSVKSILFLLKAGSGGPIGILMGFSAGLAYISGLYFVKKSINEEKKIKSYFLYLITSLTVGLVMCFFNYFVALPFWLNDVKSIGDIAVQFKKQYYMDILTFFEFLMAFNFIKFTIDSIIAHFIYRKTKNILEK
ncbi:riboflavin transporter RibU [Tepiditoga spiralis]|uniref:Riboflavin transporter n=1 Tax=Tepiditoga spiralis TaxID=2108365 RepID=A0A7G1G479_9BACT|nr:ECF transporter S component [Tepiditoga spiralis]BBE30885.1 riboflavin transporter RibU [Tepiditoga spiralis]